MNDLKPITDVDVASTESMGMNDGIIWRYMDTSRFLWMLETGALYFPNAVSFADPFEGSVPLKNVEERIERLTKAFDSPAPFREAYERLTRRPGIVFPNPEQFIDSQVQAELEMRKSLQAKHPDRESALRAWISEHSFDSLMYYWGRENVFINCWHESECESAAMWKLYSNNDHSVCIRSKITSLKKCLGEGVAIERVRYIDYTTDRVPELSNGNEGQFTAHMYKRSSFAHEREVRAMFFSAAHLGQRRTLQYGMPLRKLGELKVVDLDILIEGVFVSPDSPLWYLELLQKVVRRYGLVKEVRRSSLVADPVY